ncbi:uncharacterized protein N7479_003596 [Penicillium vulpinum]|uniref:Peptidase C39-like domain-containing protein n=1 Tax=Penicillium vulpinum TaxID=29845 RepID=A0A1V6RX27_9EURO|nr:uncharacterized protein N7479_003596 [Penicillium vulpinum]KAJ5963720.1 hypothetical protein N7479_003596 [Penicillium vulpinum]OQE05963.1 hypothetical protein PENVUL_c020G07152 [Penicillium vulpinum]
MLPQVYVLFPALLASWAAASPAFLNPRYPQVIPHPSPIEKRADGDIALPASECGSPCIVSFEPITTIVTISIPDQTVWVASVSQSVTFDFPPVTTTTVFQPSAQTFSNNDPVATPTITLQPLQVGSVMVFGSEDMDIDDAMDIDDGMAVHHHEQIILPVEYMLIDDDPVEYRKLPEYNPYDLGNNCAIITMSYLMGMGLHDFLTHVELMQPGPTRTGITTTEMQEFLEYTGRRFILGPYDSRRNSLNSLLAEFGVDKLGICYCRDDASGHCVVWEKNRFWDFQTSDAPIPFTKEPDPTLTQDEIRDVLFIETDGGIPITNYLIPRDVPIQYGNGVTGVIRVIPYFFVIY